MVPNGWTVNRLDEIAKVTSGGTPSKRHNEYWDNGDVPWIRTTEVQNCVIREQDTQVYITELGLEKSSAKLFPKGTVLMAMIGQGKTRGQVALLDFEATTNQNCAAIIFNEGQSPEYYFNFLQTQYESIRVYSNSAGQSNLSGGLVKSLLVTVPPLPEQRKIAKILSTWDKAISTTEKLIETSKQQKKALMQQLLTGKKRLINPETGKMFEGEWEEVRLSQLVKVTGGNAFKSEQFATQGIALIKISNIKPDYSISVDSSVFISEEPKYEKFKVQKGDVLIAMSGATTGKVGCYKFNQFSYLNQRVGRFDPKKNMVTRPYLFQLLKLPKVQHDILIDAVGGAQPNISNKDIERLKVLAPTINEQQKIASVLTVADKEIEVLEAKLAHFKQEKKALMQQLLTGKRRVKVDEDVAA
jgi:type I restriction enzyme S subunit